MTEHSIFLATLIAALGAGLIAGAFFAFSSFVMATLGRLPAAQGIAAMQSINIVVINPLFLGTLFGTGALCVVLVVVALLRWSAPGMGYLTLGGGLYLLGTILVTIAGNVPLNNALATVAPESDAGRAVWARYLTRWTAWNHLRTAAALAACASFVLALARAAGGGGG